jgi:hypothetical protein
MSNPIHAGAVIYAKNIIPVSAFYQQVPGLVIAHEEAEFVVLESPGFQLVIVDMPVEIATEIEITTPPVRREDTPIKLIFLVPSITAARSAALSLGGALNDPDQEWQFMDYLVCDGIDPEGNVFQLREYLL